MIDESLSAVSCQQHCDTNLTSRLAGSLLSHCFIS